MAGHPRGKAREERLDRQGVTDMGVIRTELRGEEIIKKGAKTDLQDPEKFAFLLYLVFWCYLYNHLSDTKHTKSYPPHLTAPLPHSTPKNPKQNHHIS